MDLLDPEVDLGREERGEMTDLRENQDPGEL